MNSLAACQTVSYTSDRSEVDSYLESLLFSHSQNAGQAVFEAMKYGVLGSGQRIRPVLSLRIARLVGSPLKVALAAASAVELLHCASLIIDDLPCMDNSPFRRNRASVHVEFGEATAILAAFALVALAARSVLESATKTEERDQVINFQLSLLRTLDCCGLIAGQSLDLESATSRTAHTSSSISDLKTVPLFTLAVEAGLLISSRHGHVRSALTRFGREFGLAFQMSDDLLDGEEQEVRPFFEKLDLLRQLVTPFGPDAREIESLIDYLNDRVTPKQSYQQSA
jgi:geranylgeranyl pyrophosphate synthase